MAMKIKMNAEARTNTAVNFGNETRKYKVKPNVIYMKGPKDRLYMMTESVDQSFKRLPRDKAGIYGGRLFLPHEKNNLISTLERKEWEDLQEKTRTEEKLNEKILAEKQTEENKKGTM